MSSTSPHGLTSPAWTVEAYLNDGAIEQTIFIGPQACERAEGYLKSQYGVPAEPGDAQPPA
jgi:hypothetical protein